MKALITTLTEHVISTCEIVLRGKEQTMNTKIANQIEEQIKRELRVGRKTYKVEVCIKDNNRIVNRWEYIPTIR